MAECQRKPRKKSRSNHKTKCLVSLYVKILIKKVGLGLDFDGSSCRDRWGDVGGLFWPREEFSLGLQQARAAGRRGQ